MKLNKALQVVAARGLETREKALDARVGIDCQKWGMGEQAASRRLHGTLSHALLLNSIAVANVDAIDEELRAAAKALMTADDTAFLRKGG